MTAAEDVQVSADNFPPGSWTRGNSMRWTPRLEVEDPPPWSWLCAAPMAEPGLDTCQFQQLGPDCPCLDCQSAARWIAEDVGHERTADAAERGDEQ